MLNRLPHYFCRGPAPTEFPTLSLHDALPICLAAHPRYTIEELNWVNEGGKAQFSGFFELAPRMGDELEKAAFKADLPRAVLQEVVGQEKGDKGAMRRVVLDELITKGQQLNVSETEEAA